MRALEYVGNCVIVKAFSMTKDQMLEETIHANWLQHNWFKLMLKLQQVNRIKQKLVDFNDEKKIRIASIVKSNSCDASSLFIHNHFFFVRSIHRKFTVWIARLNSAYNFFLCSLLISTCFMIYLQLRSNCWPIIRWYCSFQLQFSLKLCWIVFFARLNSLIP